MLRIINITRSVGANIFRSSIREDRPKSSISQTPAQQFLFWFNEVPGSFTPGPRSISTNLLSTSNNNNTRDLVNYTEFSEHHDHKHGFDHNTPFSYLRAVQCSALLAVSYSILHDKYLSRLLQDSFQHVSLESILRAHCPILSVKQQKTVHAESTRRDTGEYSVTAQFDHKDDHLKQDAPASTSDYSSTRSQSESSSQELFTPEEASLLQIEKLIPDDVDEMLSLIQNIRQGDRSAVRRLTQLSQDSPMAQFYLGQIYQHGIIVSTNNKKAFKYYSQASAGGLAEASFNLGLMYLHGEAVSDESHEVMEETGLKLIHDAADAGITEARNMLGLKDETESRSDGLSLEQQEDLFRKGLIMEENILCDEEDKWFALDLYKVAAELGHDEARERYRKLSSKL